MQVHDTSYEETDAEDEKDEYGGAPGRRKTAERETQGLV